MSSDSRKLISLAQELFQIYNELGQGNERECLYLVDELDKMRQKFLTSFNENVGLKQMLATYETESQTKRSEIKNLKDQLKQSRAQIAALLSAKQSAEAEKADLEGQIEKVQNLLRDDVVGFLPEKNRRELAFLQHIPHRSRAVGSMSLLEDDQDVDYDRTGDSLDDNVSVLRSGRIVHRPSSGAKKRSRSAPKVKPQPSIREEQNEDFERPAKRSKEDANVPAEQIVTTTTLTLPYNSHQPAVANLEIKRKSLNRSFSEPHLAAQPSAPPAGLDANKPYMKSLADLLSPQASSPGIGSWASGGSLSSRRHTFGSKTILKPEYCDACCKRIAFGKTIYKCTDCRFTCHGECRDRAPVPCVPRNATPQKGVTRTHLLDHVPNSRPLIPHVIIHCVTELERRGVGSMVGIYRIPGSEKQVQDLLHDFVTRRGVPIMRAVDDIAVITGCIKKFLSQLSEPLVPTGSWQEFVQSAEDMRENPEEGTQAMHQAINALPLPNRDTLAYLLVHWQTVAEASHLNKMPLENLAKVLGPTVVGNSTASSQLAMTKAFAEVGKQEMVMNALLSLPNDYWGRFLDFGSTPLVDDGTPELASMLGTIRNTPRGGRGVPVTPRSIKTRQQRRFFQPAWK